MPHDQNETAVAPGQQRAGKATPQICVLLRKSNATAIAPASLVDAMMLGERLPQLRTRRHGPHRNGGYLIKLFERWCKWRAWL